MSLVEFQRALAELIASPSRCLEVRANGVGALAGFSLTERECARLRQMSCSEGMSANCTLYRVNRLIPVYAVLPNTCRLLGRRLGPELEAFAAASRHATLQYRWEAWRFGAWLRDRIDHGMMPGGPVADSIRLELAAFDARTAPPGSPERQRIVRLYYDPDELLNPAANAAELRPLSSPTAVLVDATGPTLSFYRISTDPLSDDPLRADRRRSDGSSSSDCRPGGR